MEVKKDILWRVYLVYLFICLFGVAIIAKVCVVQFSEGEEWKARAQTLTTQVFNIEAVRGNIYDAGGSLLATSLPYYEVGIDVNTDHLVGLEDAEFGKLADSLARSLAALLGDRPSRDYARMLHNARASRDRYVLLARNVSYQQLQAMKSFPLFRLGRNRGGFVFLQTNKRERPFRILAARTIGYEREGIQPVGLEGAFNEDLKGVSGQRLMQKIAGGVWKPINDENEVEPKDGRDLISTIDINIQDVAEHALMVQLIKNNAAYGCVVLMEVQTGEIKAIANLGRKDTSIYYEDYNYAIGSATEPGSTFKLATLMAAMEDGYVEPTDIVDLRNGTREYYDRTMKDSHEPEVRKVTVQRAFEISSNVGISSIAWNHYSKNPQQFIDRLLQMNLDDKLGLAIYGEGAPRIKTTADKDWYGTSLPWISIGYESQITPMQTLAFYNAVANDGVLVRPRLVKEIRDKGKVVKTFGTEVINPAICSKATIDKAKQMLEGVVQNGTARNLKGSSYRVAGKTGTAQIANKGLYKNAGNVCYQASFVGYFPADKPKYSCIVVVNGPSNGIYYGNLVAGPIFKEIADKVYSGSLDIHPEVNASALPFAAKAPFVKPGKQKDIMTVLDKLGIRTTVTADADSWVSAVMADTATVRLDNRRTEGLLRQYVMPNVTGMMAKDALFLLENHGFRVKISGSGVVSAQSVPPGTRFARGTYIELQLS